MVLQKIKEDKVVAIFRNVELSTLLMQTEVLLKNGFRVLEVTLNSKGAFNSIAELKKRYGEELCIGAGTVVDQSDVRRVKDFGGEFIISPNIDQSVIKETKARGLISISGALTPTEIFSAYMYGADMVKVFPATALGIEYAKNLKGPFPDIPLMATGGIDEHNAADYLQNGYEAVGLGSALTQKENESEEDFKRKMQLLKTL